MTKTMSSTPPHTEAAHFALSREGANVDTVAVFTIDGEPVSKARARFTSQGSKVRTYTPEKTLQAERAVAAKFREAAPGHQPDAENTYGIFGIFFAGTRQRRDVDNMIKLLCDGLNKVAWADDVQVVEVSGRRGFDIKENARTEVWVYRVGSAPKPPTTPCIQCGEPQPIYDSWLNKRKYCSPACRSAATRDRRTVECAGCHEKFVSPGSHPPKYCSENCRIDSEIATYNCVQCGESVTKPRSQRTKHALCGAPECRRIYWNAQRKGSAKGQCSTCGGPTSKKSYTNCRGCAPAAAKRGAA